MRTAMCSRKSQTGTSRLAASPRRDAELTAPLTRRESYERINKEAACVILKLVMQLSAQSVLGAAICAVGGGTIIPFRLTTALDSVRHT